MNNMRLIELLLKKRTGELSSLEEAELNMLLSDVNIAEMQNIMSFLKLPLLFDSEVSNEQSSAAFARTMQKVNRKREIKRIWLRSVAAAASVLLVLSISMFYLSDKNAETKMQSVVATKRGAKSTLLLPDGTKVWLNADSRLSYSKTFGVGTRDVYLSGEAFFDVAHDKEHPFIVHTKTLDVKVLGTAFNLRAYENEQNTQTTLIRGKVEIELKNNKEKRIVLQPNEKVIVQNEYVKQEANSIKNSGLPEISLTSIKHGKADSSVVMETEWVRNKLAFEQETLANIALTLERWYNTDIEIKDSSLAAKKFRGVFENKTLEEVIGSLQLAGSFHYTVKNNKITIDK